MPVKLRKMEEGPAEGEDDGQVVTGQEEEVDDTYFWTPSRHL